MPQGGDIAASTGTSAEDQATKTGRRHSAADEAIIRRAYASARQLIDDLTALGYTPEEAEAAADAIREQADGDQPAETTTALGGMVKHVKQVGDEIHVGGYLITYGDPKQTDLTGDYFTKDTDFGPFDRAVVFFEHGFDDELGRQPIGIGHLKKTDVGVWIDAILKARNEYVRALGTIADKLGWSSGVASHTVVRKSIRPGVNEITQWHLGPDASLTATPAEPRNKATTLKSLLTAAATAAPDGASGERRQFSAAVTESEKQADPSLKTTASGGKATMTENTQPIDYQRDYAELKTAMFDAIKAGDDSLAAKFEKLAKDIETKLNALPSTKSAPLTGAEDIEVKRDSARAAVQEYMRSGETRRGFAFEIKAPLTSGTVGTGGALVPVVQLPELITPMVDDSILRRAGVNIVSVTGTNSVRLPAMANSGAAVLTAETVAFNQAEPTFTLQTYTPYKYTRISQATDENLADSGLDVFGQVLAPDAQQAFALAENTAFAVGTGSSQPQGITVGGTTTTAAAAAAIAADDLINLYHALPYQHRPNGAWFMNDAIALVIRKLKDTTNQYLWQPGLQLGQPDLILGRPVYTLNTMVATVATTNRTVVFMDPRYYRIVDFGGLEFKRLEERYAELGMVGFRWHKRFDAKVALASAVRVLVQA